MHAVWVLGGALCLMLVMYVIGVNGAIAAVLEREELERNITLLKAGMTEKELVVSERGDLVTFEKATDAGFVKVSPYFVEVSRPVVGFNAQ